MKIENSQLALTSKHESIKSYEKEEHLTMWVGDSQQGAQGTNNGLPSILGEIRDLLEISGDAQKRLLANPPAITPTSQEDCLENEITDEDKLKVQLLESFIETLTGKKVKIHIPGIKVNKAELDKLQNLEAQAPQRTERAGWGVIYDFHEAYYEQESVSFAAKGVIKTQDGREIKLDLQFNMSREFYSQTDIHLRMGDAAKVDPLVINFAGSAPALTDAKFTFDLDADGTMDQISFLREGSGFLALDINEDGIINDGRELFGPQSGDGFGDLAGYDQDGNGWIDENDDIFAKLRIWTKDSQGQDQLVALGQKGLGAIYLGHISTLFDMKNTANEMQGQLRESGIFLRENGTAGTIQHIDLAV